VTESPPSLRATRDLVRAGRLGELRDSLVDLHPNDVAELLIQLPMDEEGVVFRVLPRDLAAQAFAYLPPDRQEELLRSLSTASMRAVLNQMPPDDRTRLLEEMPYEVTHRLLSELSPEELRAARDLLGYPEDTAGRYMTPRYVAVRPEMTVRDALDHVRKNGRGKETLNILYIVDSEGRLLDDVRLGTLLLAAPDTPLAAVQDAPLVSIPATASREDVLKTFERYDRIALPVTDSLGHMVGIVTADDMLELAETQATEAIHRFGGLEALDAPYLLTKFRHMVRKRIGWLAILFVGEMFTATAMGFFEREIERAVVLALFVPLIISSGGNSGSQATSLMIRSLALKELRLGDWIRVFRREIATGLVIGAVLGLIGFLRIVVWEELRWADYGTHPFLVGIAVALSLVGVVTWGTVAGSMLPFALRRLGFDPATSSAPFVATVVDVTGLCIYFGVALVVLRGTLL